MKNEFLSDVKSEHEAALLETLPMQAAGKVLLDLLGRRLERVKVWLRDPGEHPENWRRDVRWLKAQEDMLEDLVALPQAARERQRAAEGESK